MKSFNLTILNPEKIIYQGAVESLVLPCARGYLGVLSDHAPLVASLMSGRIMLREPTGETVNLEYKGKGFLEVFHNQVSILLSNSMIEGK